MRAIYRFDGFIFASLIGGLILTIVPLPDAINAWRPAWLAMLVLYWTLHRFRPLRSEPVMRKP